MLTDWVAVCIRSMFIGTERVMMVPLAVPSWRGLGELTNGQLLASLLQGEGEERWPSQPCWSVRS